MLGQNKLFSRESGVYKIQPISYGSPVFVYCQLDDDDQALWTVSIQREYVILNDDMATVILLKHDIHLNP